MAHANDTVEVNGKGGASGRQGKALVRATAPVGRARGVPKESPQPQAPAEPEVKDGWLEFDVPGGADEKGKDVYASIRNVHRQAYIDLAFLGRCRWNGYKSVESKLRIAATALQGGAQAQAQALVDEARATYKEQLAAQRKVSYLVGVTLGIGLLAGLQLALHGAIGSLNGVITEDFALQMVLFAGMGTLASVLTRIGQFRVEVYATRPLVLISGASRPLVAVFVAFRDLRVPSQRPRDGDGEREQRVGREQRDVHLPLGGVPVRVLRAIRKARDRPGRVRPGRRRRQLRLGRSRSGNRARLDESGPVMAGPDLAT